MCFPAALILGLIGLRRDRKKARAAVATVIGTVGCVLMLAEQLVL